MKWFLPFGLLALAASSTVVLADDSDWWKTISLYQIYPRSFQDSDGDGIGDLPGIESRLEHLVDAGVDAVWISPIYPSPMIDFGYDISNFTAIEPMFGTMEDFESLMAKANSLGLKVLLDYVPNHTSDQHEWFVKSLAGIEPYKDYYVWHNGTVLENGTIAPPNNWMSHFSGSAWEWRDERQAYYLHQFCVEQPDLNYTNEYVVEEMKEVLVFWLNKGVAGFRVDAVYTLFEAEGFPDEPLSGTTNVTTDYNYVSHFYTSHQQRTYEMVQVWRELIDNYTLHSDQITRIMTTESYGNWSMVMKYYDYGSHIPFNFKFITEVSKTSSASDFKDVIDLWMDSMPTGGTANWVIGNHDQSRVATRFGTDRLDGVSMMILLLPGVGVIYNGDEIGMEDTWFSWEDTVDPQACNTNSEVYESYSRDPGRSPYQWDNTTSAGFSTNATTWLPVNDNYVSLNLAAQKAADESHYKIFQKLTALRKLPVIQEGTVNTQVLSDEVLAFSRELTGYESVIVLINFASNAKTVSLDDFTSAPETLTIYAASMDSGLTVGAEMQRSSVELPAMAAVVFSSTSTSSASTFLPSIAISLFAVALANL